MSSNPEPTQSKSRWAPLSQQLGAKAPPPPAGAQLLTERLYNRDLSWLQFNDRVLGEAADPTVPPLERLRFAGIVSSNLDEFFMVRVAEIARLAARSAKFNFPDGMDARQLMTQIREEVLRQKARQSRELKEILEALKRGGIQLQTSFGEDQSADRVLKEKLADAPLLINRSEEPLPELLGQRIYVFVRFPREYAIVDIGDRSSRLVELPSDGQAVRCALADRWLAERAPALFAKREVIEAFPFRILRDAELGYSRDEEEALEKQILQSINNRPKDARIIRLEVDAPSYSEGALFLATHLGVDSAALYRFDLPLDLRALTAVYDAEDREKLRYPAVRPQVPPFLRTKDIFPILKKGDVLLHHPYDAFDVVVQFLAQAAQDAQVTEIYHSLYRTSASSPIIEWLKEAAQRGKKVTAYVEIRARFDELANVRWTEELRKSGVRVVRPMGGYKVHTKITRITRLEDGKEAVYCHLGTGNYHPGTALQYTDLGLLTADEKIGAETGAYFKALSQREKPSGYADLLVAPGNLHEQFLRLIQQETRIQKAGGRGLILAKMNSLVDPDIIGALYEASTAGVKVELMVRGICCLRAGIGGLSENIRVTSVIDRFLEHSRIFYFRNGGGDAQLLYLSSADWMPRNFYTRYEIAFPVKDPLLRRFIRDVVLRNGLNDTAKGWELKPDGSYERPPVPDGTPRIRSQELFQKLARQNYRETPLETRFNEKAAAPAAPRAEPPPPPGPEPV